MKQIRRPVDDEVLVGEIRSRIDTAQQFDDSQPIESSMRVMYGSKYLLAAVASGLVSLLYREVFPEDTFLVAHVPRSDELIPTPDTEIQIPGFLWGKIDPHLDRFLFS